jgi:hypothetical protein
MKSRMARKVIEMVCVATPFFTQNTQELGKTPAVLTVGSSGNKGK